MSTSEPLDHKNENVDNSGLGSPQLPKKKIQAMFQELEIMAMQKGGRNSLDLTTLDKQQLDKILDTMAENEKNAFSYHSKRLEVMRDIELRRIDASVINQKTV